MVSLLDNTLLTANDLGILSDARDITDTFDATDRIAFYKFTIPQNSDLAVAFSGVSLRADLIVDSNGNGIVENSELITGALSSVNSSGNFLEPLPAGNYFLRLRTFSTQLNEYSLRLVPTLKPGNVAPDPGNSLAEATNLGALAGRLVLKDYIGELDDVDFYRFTLRQNSNLGVVASGETQVAPIRIIADRNANGVLDRGETIAGRFGINPNLSVKLPVGTYFIQVGQVRARSTQYTFTFTQSVDFSGNDTLRGTPRRDTLRGFGGNDIISGLGENDLLLGGVGNDQLFGNAGNDSLLGDAGNDRLVGDRGNDVLSGGLGNDVLDAGIGNDVITTGGGRDRILLRRGQGFDRVQDFRNNLDKLDLIGISFGQLTVRQQGNDVLIKLGTSNLLLLENTSRNLIDRTDFV